MGTTKGNTTDDLQGSRQIDHQLRRTCLESKPTKPTRKIQYTQNEALRIATGCHKMSSIDHLHTEAGMLKVKHSELLCCCCLPTPMTLASWGSPMFPLVVHQPASPSIWPAVQSLRRGLSTNPGATMWCVCG